MGRTTKIIQSKISNKQHDYINSETKEKHRTLTELVNLAKEELQHDDSCLNEGVEDFSQEEVSSISREKDLTHYHRFFSENTSTTQAEVALMEQSAIKVNS